MNVRIQITDNGGLDQDTSSEIGKQWSDSGYISNKICGE